MAEGLLRQALPGKNVLSAGIGAMVGHPADPFAHQLMMEQGIDISAHRAQALTTKMVSEADMVLTMDTEQKRYIEKKYPTARGKVFRLGEFSNYDIADPYRKDLNTFCQTRDLINQGIAILTKRLAHIN